MEVPKTWSINKEKEMISKILVLILNVILATSFLSCAMLFTHRSFVDEMEREDADFFIAGRDFQAIAGDEGVTGRSDKEIMLRTPASSPYRKRFDQEAGIENELMSLERGLGDVEYTEYLKVKDYLPTDSEKIYYLRLTTRQTKIRYLQSRGLFNVFDQKLPNVDTDFAIENEELLLGMSREGVKRSWGQPIRIDVAGHAKSGNERWSYYERGKVKQVFFENGRVQGWVVE